MTGDLYIQSVIDHVPPGMAVRDHIAMDLRSHIAERTSRGEPIDAVLAQLGDPLKLAESYLSAVPLVSARLLLRVAAKLIDILIVAPAIIAITALGLFITGWPDGSLLIILCVFAIAFGFPAYTALTEYEYGRTVGKRLMHIRVVRESGARISFGNAVVRQLPFLAQFFWVDALFALFTDRRQRAFELLTKTRAVAAILWIVLVTPMTGAAQPAPVDIGPPPGRLVDIGGRKLHLNCTGTGSPIVVLESGASSFAIDWALVQPEVATTTRVCSYDRAGMGWSDAGEPERPDRVVRDLQALLAAAAEKPPYVLVGASRGGLYTRIYQRRHPSEVVGLVQVDPSHEERLFTMFRGTAVAIAELTADQILETIPPGTPRQPPARTPQTGAPFDRLPDALYRARVELERRLIATIANTSITRDLVVDAVTGDHAALSELWQVSHSGERPLGAMPIVVLTRGRDSSADAQRVHALLAAQSARGRHQIVDDSYHEIHLSHPRAVIDAIREVVKAARGADALLR